MLLPTAEAANRFVAGKAADEEEEVAADGDEVGSSGECASGNNKVVGGACWRDCRDRFAGGGPVPGVPTGERLRFGEDEAAESRADDSEGSDCDIAE